jgi:hypothetical protein
MNPSEPVVTRHTAVYKMNVSDFLAALEIPVSDSTKVSEVTAGRLGHTLILSVTTTDIPHMNEVLKP